MSLEILAIILFASILILILYGFPVAFTLGGISIIYAICFLEPSSYSALPPRIMGVMSNYVLLAVPLFVFMGLMLEKSGLAESLLETMAMLFGQMKGGIGNFGSYCRSFIGSIYWYCWCYSYHYGFD